MIKLPAPAARRPLGELGRAPAVRHRRRDQPGSGAGVHAWTARVVASAAEPTPTRVLGPDSAELDAEELWHVALGVLRRSVAAGCPTPRDPQRSRSPASARRVCCSAPMGCHSRRSSPGTTPGPRGELEWLLTEVGFERAAPYHRSVRRPDLQPAQAALVPRQHPELLARRRRGSTSATISPGGCAASGRPTSAWPRAPCCSISNGGAGRKPLLEATELPRDASCRRSSPTAVGSARIAAEVAAATGLARGLCRRRRRSRPCLRHDRRGRRCRWASSSTAWAPPRRSPWCAIGQ